VKGGGATPPTPTLLSAGRRARKGGGGKGRSASARSPSSSSSPSSTSPSPLEGEGRGGGNPAAAPQTCPNCRKPPSLCVCAAIAPIATRAELVILQHPQEQGHALGTAFLAHRQFKNSRLVVGLSWPSLAAALARPSAEPRRWGVLYLGPLKPAGLHRVLSVVDAHGAPLADQDHFLAALDGVVLLDGSWSQAKALWWRNPWLLKLRRLVLAPPRPSLYGALRKEPRGDSVSTIEAAAYCLAALADDAALAERALAPLRLLLARNDGGAPARRPDRRRHVHR
jgi:DTW domain-containing protein